MFKKLQTQKKFLQKIVLKKKKLKKKTVYGLYHEIIKSTYISRGTVPMLEVDQSCEIVRVAAVKVTPSGSTK